MRRFGDRAVGDEDLDQLVTAVAPSPEGPTHDNEGEARFEFTFCGEDLEALVFDHHGHRGLYIQRRSAKD